MDYFPSLSFLLDPEWQVTRRDWCPAAGCRTVSGQVMRRGELDGDGSAVGLCFRRNVEAALAG